MTVLSGVDFGFVSVPVQRRTPHARLYQLRILQPAPKKYLYTLTNYPDSESTSSSRHGGPRKSGRDYKIESSALRCGTRKLGTKTALERGAVKLPSRTESSRPCKHATEISTGMCCISAYVCLYKTLMQPSSLPTPKT